jgi:undecaprenyl diphosphate synthase
MDESGFSSSTDAVPAVGSVPRHIAVIMDGNGRWANGRGMPRIAGHRRGVEAVRETVRGCGRWNVEYLTLFAFSSENWRRPATEVRLLMQLFARALESEARKLREAGVRLRVVGDLSRFSDRIQSLVARAEALTADNHALTLTIAANYGGRWDITQACRKVAREVREGRLEPEAVEATHLQDRLCTSFLPEPDLFIRTGGEQRISNFLMWQLAYTELHFTDVLWPDFGARELDAAIESYGRRQRRFGQTGEQVAERTEARRA